MRFIWQPKEVRACSLKFQYIQACHSKNFQIITKSQASQNSQSEDQFLNYLVLLLKKIRCAAKT